MKTTVILLLTSILISISCNSNTAVKRKVKTERDLIYSSFFNNVYYTETVGEFEIQSRKQDLIRLALIAWLMSAEEEVKPCWKLLKEKVSKDEVYKYLIELRSATAEVHTNQEMKSTAIQDADRSVILIVPCVSQKMVNLFSPNNNEGGFRLLANKS